MPLSSTENPKNNHSYPPTFSLERDNNLEDLRNQIIIASEQILQKLKAQITISSEGQSYGGNYHTFIPDYNPSAIVLKPSKEILNALNIINCEIIFQENQFPILVVNNDYYSSPGSECEDGMLIIKDIFDRIST